LLGSGSNFIAVYVIMLHQKSPFITLRNRCAYDHFCQGVDILMQLAGLLPKSDAQRFQNAFTVWMLFYSFGSRVYIAWKRLDLGQVTVLILIYYH
jgi:hypothetical protein